MPNQPTVSVIIPTYNRAHLVGRAIQSVLNQTYQDFEVIIVDDGSTDNTEEIIKEFQKNNKRIRCIKHKQNVGGSAARNTGIKASRGEYIAFLDSGDEWFSSKIEKQLKLFLLGDANLGAVGSGKIVVHSNMHKSEIKIPKGYFGDIYKGLLKGESFPGATSTIVIKKECFEKAGLFDESLKSSQEYDLYIRVAKYYYFDVVREPLVKWIFESNSIGSDMNAQVQGKKRMLQKYSVEMPKISKQKAYCNFVIGSILCRRNKMKEGRKYLLKSVISYPLRLKYYLGLLTSLFPFSIFKYIISKRKAILDRKLKI